MNIPAPITAQAIIEQLNPLDANAALLVPALIKRSGVTVNKKTNEIVEDKRGRVLRNLGLPDLTFRLECQRQRETKNGGAQDELARARIWFHVAEACASGDSIPELSSDTQSLLNPWIVTPELRFANRKLGKVQADKEHDARNRAADPVRIKEFHSRDLTVEYVMDWMYRIRPTDTKNIRKRAVKALYRLQHGSKLYSIHDLFLLGELTREEAGERVSLVAILDKYPVNERRLAESAIEAERLCALGSKCLHSYRRKPAIVTKDGKYCSEICLRAAASLAARRPKKPEIASISPELAGSGSGTRINTGVYERP